MGHTKRKRFSHFTVYRNTNVSRHLFDTYILNTHRHAVYLCFQETQNQASVFKTHCLAGISAPKNCPPPPQMPDTLPPPPGRPPPAPSSWETTPLKTGPLPAPCRPGLPLPLPPNRKNNKNIRNVHQECFDTAALRLKWPFTEWEAGPEQKKSLERGKRKWKMAATALKWPKNGRRNWKNGRQNQAKIPWVHFAILSAFLKRALAQTCLWAWYQVRFFRPIFGHS